MPRNRNFSGRGSNPKVTKNAHSLAPVAAWFPESPLLGYHGIMAMHLEDLEKQYGELKKRVEMVRSYL
jgi:hypothetical protein